MDAKTIVDALAGCSAGQLEHIGYNIAKGWLRAVYDAEHPPKPADPPKPRKMVLPEIVRLAEQEPEREAAIESWARNEEHTCPGDGACQICKAWQPERERRVKRLASMYAKARRAGITPSAHELSDECLIPVDTVRRFFADAGVPNVT